MRQNGKMGAPGGTPSSSSSSSQRAPLVSHAPTDQASASANHEIVHQNQVVAEQAAALRQVAQAPAHDARRVLGVARAAVISTADATRAFRTLSKLVHPDKNSDPRAAEAFKKVHAAYVSLKEEIARDQVKAQHARPASTLSAAAAAAAAASTRREARGAQGHRGSGAPQAPPRPGAAPRGGSSFPGGEWC
eukprot:6187796-Pleurochrysis_carterae.AAC.1